MNGSKSFATGSHQLPVVTLSGNSEAVITGDVVFCISGDMSTTANAEIIIALGTFLVVYIDGNLALGGNDILDSDANPQNLLIVGFVTSTAANISGSSDF